VRYRLVALNFVPGECENWYRDLVRVIEHDLAGLNGKSSSTA
jgi:hypothetical protein